VSRLHPGRRLFAGFIIVSLCATLSVGCAEVTRRVSDSPTRAGAASPEPSWSLVAGYSTTFKHDQSERNQNIARAARALDGTVLEPGATWSFNRTVGPRTRKRGYEVAPVLEFEGARPALGGGICQVSTTVYNAALLADARVAQRHPHSRPVGYVQLGRDATVSWGSKDLRLVNPHPFPLRLHTRVVHNRLSVAIYAPKQLGYEVRLTTGDAEPASLRREYQTLDGSDRMAVDGVWVKLYRHRVEDGSVVQTERIGRSSYYPFRVPEAHP